MQSGRHHINQGGSDSVARFLSECLQLCIKWQADFAKMHLNYAVLHFQPSRTTEVLQLCCHSGVKHARLNFHICLILYMGYADWFCLTRTCLATISLGMGSYVSYGSEAILHLPNVMVRYILNFLSKEVSTPPR